MVYWTLPVDPCRHRQRIPLHRRRWIQSRDCSRYRECSSAVVPRCTRKTSDWGFPLSGRLDRGCRCSQDSRMCTQRAPRALFEGPLSASLQLQRLPEGCLVLPERLLGPPNILGLLSLPPAQRSYGSCCPPSDSYIFPLSADLGTGCACSERGSHPFPVRPKAFSATEW